MQGPAKIATYLGVGMTLLGFALIAFAWNGAAELDFIQGQFPYLLSGGLGGLGLIIGGMAVLAIQTQRTITAQRGREMERLQAEADALIRHMIKPGPGEVIDDETVIDVGARTVIRTVERRPAQETVERRPAQEAEPRALPAEPDGTAADGYAPRPRSGRTSPPGQAGDAEEPTSVAVLQRDEAATRDGAWAPPADEPERIRAVLADVSGVGPAKQQQLVEHFGSLEALRAASVEDLVALPGISRTLAARVHRATT